jgi:hypothetical protein
VRPCGLEERLELPGAAAVRRRVVDRRALGEAILAEQTRGIRSPLGPLSVAGTNADPRVEPAICDGHLGRSLPDPGVRAVERQAVLLRASGRPGTAARITISGSLVTAFSGCQLVLGAGPGVVESLARLRDHGVPALALTPCPQCQAAARRAGLRVADGDAAAYFAGDNSLGADGAVLYHVVERLTPGNTVSLLRSVRVALPAGAPLAVVGASPGSHVDSAIGHVRFLHELRFYPVDFLSKLAAAAGFEVLGVSLL